MDELQLGLPERGASSDQSKPVGAVSAGSLRDETAVRIMRALAHAQYFEAADFLPDPAKSPLPLYPAAPWPGNARQAHLACE